MLPGMGARSSTDLSSLWAGKAVFGDFFDERWFLETVEGSCPGMVVYQTPEDTREGMREALPGRYLPRTGRLDESFENSRQAYLEHLEAWLEASEGYKADADGEGTTLVTLQRTLWDVDTRSLPQGFRRNFGQLLRVNPAIRRFAAVVVQQLALKYGLHIDPKDAIPEKAFYGAHLRTEQDAKNAGWLNEPHSNISAQTDAYILQAVKHKLNVIYVASGNHLDILRFEEKAAAHTPPLNVTSKFDLLPSHEASILRGLTWDQQALVDYEVLQRCSVYGGFVKSSFSYSVGLTRNQWLEDMGRVVDPWVVTHTEVGVAFDDGLSRMLARDGWHEHRIPTGMWP